MKKLLLFIATSLTLSFSANADSGSCKVDSTCHTGTKCESSKKCSINTDKKCKTLTADCTKKKCSTKACNKSEGASKTGEHAMDESATKGE